MHRVACTQPIAGLLLACLGLAAGCAAPAVAPSGSQQHPVLGREVAFTLPDGQGQLQTVPSAPARATILDFWATDCAPCARSVPELAALRERLAASAVELHFVGVLRRDESLKDARHTLDTWGTSTPFLADRDGGVQRRLQLDLLPATLILDAQGRARWLAPNPTTAAQIESAAIEIAR
jgi:thiol-disulfide isomerase/thioredoxin